MTLNQNALIRWPSKDPADEADYIIEWADALDIGETILTSTWALSAEADQIISLGAEAFSPDTTRIWLSGGLNGRHYVLTNRVTTSVGRTFERSALLFVVDK